MNKKKIIAIGVSCLIILVGYHLFSRQSAEVPTNIIGKDKRVTPDDIRLYFKNMKFDDKDVSKYFSNDLVNPYTIKFFKFLQGKFSQMSLEDHLKAVEEYLRSIMPPKKAEEMFALYKKFTLYEKSLMDVTKKWGTPKTADEALNYLKNLQDYRRNYFGKDIADGLFGAEVKNHEYRVRKFSILNDKKMYGAEKEKQLKELQGEMWGRDSGSVDSNAKPFDRYQEKMVMYQKDLGELNDTDRKDKVREYRKEFFSEEVVARLEKVDEQIEGEKKQEEDYRSREAKIQSDLNLKPEEKEARIRALQEEIFGSEGADEFRRRENIRKAQDAWKRR